MAWMSPTIPKMYPGEDPKQYWESARKIHNDFAEKFNKDWLNRLSKRQIPLMPSFEEITEKLKEDHEKANS